MNNNSDVSFGLIAVFSQSRNRRLLKSVFAVFASFVLVTKQKVANQGLQMTCSLCLLRSLKETSLVFAVENLLNKV